MQPYASGSPWKSSLRDSVSNRAFSNFKVSVAIVSLSLSLTPTPTPTPSHSQTRALSLSHKPTHSHRISLTHTTVARPLTLSASLTTPSLILSLSQPHTHTHTLSLLHKPKHSHRVSLTHATVARPPTLSASPMLPSLVLHIVFKISEFWLVIIELWSPSVCTVSENQKKKVSPFMQNAKCKVCFTVCMLRNSGKNGRIFCESFFFFFFWFLFWISNRTVKKDWNFIVFWVRIVFLGLFIFWVCLGFRVLSFGFRWLFRC